MADKRMFSKVVVESDDFLDMPPTAQNLYFHLGMEADDDGFLNNARKIQRMIGAADDDLKLLIAKGFLIRFDSGLVVIRHWRINNYIAKDRHHQTLYQAEFQQLEQDNNHVYNLYTTCIQPVYESYTENRLDKISIDKISIDKISIDKDREVTDDTKPARKPARHQYGSYKNVLLTDADIEKLKAEFPSDWSNRIERLSGYIASTGKSYKNHLATIRNWARMDKERGKPAAAQNQFYMPEPSADIPDFIDFLEGG